MTITITQRQAVLGMLGVQIAGAAILCVMMLIGRAIDQAAMMGVAAILYGALLAAYIKGWEPARYINAVIMTISIGLTITEPNITQQFALQLVIVPIIILLQTDWWWTLGSIIVMFGMVLYKAGGTGIYTEPKVILLYLVTLFAVALLWKIAESNEHQAIKNAERADDARQRAEHDRQLAEQRSTELAKINQEQESLLELVSQLEIPAIQVADGVLIAPLIGNLDTRRAQAITKRLLGIAHERHVHLVILDVTGISMLDTTIAQHLLKTAQSLQLLGCKVTITGITADVALSLVGMGVDISSDMVDTARTPQEALQQFSTQKQHWAGN